MRKLLALSVTLFLIIPATHIQAQAKIGYISPDELLAIMPEVKKADTLIAAFQQELSKSYQDQQTELNAAVDKFIQDSTTMTDIVKEIKRKELQERISGLGARKQDLNTALENEKEKQLAPIRQKLLQAIKDVAKENGYGHVLYKDQAIVFPEANDLAALVKKKLGIK